jgi:hypothetical protein
MSTNQTCGVIMEWMVKKSAPGGRPGRMKVACRRGAGYSKSPLTLDQVVSSAETPPQRATLSLVSTV